MKRRQGKQQLTVDPSWPFLGASPDGFVDNDIILEVKCPFDGRNSMIKLGKFFPFLIQDGDSVTLKKTHKCYFQIAGQLALSGRKECHFLMYTHADLLVLQISHNPHRKNASKLSIFLQKPLQTLSI